MDKISKNISELTTDDSCSSVDKAEEVSLSGSVVSNDPSEVNSVNDVTVSSKPAGSSRPTTPVATTKTAGSSRPITPVATRNDATVSTKPAGSSRPTTPVATRYGQRARNRLNITNGLSSAVSTDTEEVSPLRSISTRSGKKRNDATLKKLTHNQTMKFMENFDPERSNRERKKLTRQISSSGKRKPTLYDEKGVLMAAEVDMCDCLEESCPGCHFPCPKCHSNKCGHECRQNRRWTYEEIWVEGTDIVIHNPLLTLK